MTARPIDTEKASIRITLPRALSLAGVLFLAGGWAAIKLDRIDSRLASLQQTGWTLQDQERQMNWLRWDNQANNLKVRDSREVVAARTP